MKRIISILFLVLLFSCTGENAKVVDKHQKKRDNVVDISSEIVAADVDDLFVGYGSLVILGEYLIYANPKSFDGLVHVLDKNNFEYIGGGVQKGRGPGEVINLGRLFVDESNRRFFLADHSKNKIFEYDVDKFLEDPLRYLPKEKADVSGAKMMSTYQYVDDTLCFGTIIESIGSNDFINLFGRWNMLTGEFSHEQRETKGRQKRRTAGYASVENGIIVEAFQRDDLLTISNLEGETKYNIMGPKWGDDNQTLFYSKVAVYGDRIIVGYSGMQHGDNGAYQPKKLMIFDLKGNYIRTLDVGLLINEYCIDKENNRVVLSVDDAEMQIVYFDLDLIK